MHKKIGIELEFLMEDKGGKPISFLDNKPAIDELIKLSKKNHNIPTIKKELNTCQVEITNNGPKETIDSAIDEILEFYNKLKKNIELLSYKYNREIILSTDPVSRYNDDLGYSKDKKYSKIIDIITEKDQSLLPNFNVRGIHIHYGLRNKKKSLEIINKIITAYSYEDILDFLKGNYTDERLKKINEIVDCLGGKFYSPIQDYDNYDINNYSYLRYTIHNSIENRFFDFGQNIQDANLLYKKILNCTNKSIELIEK